MTAAEALILRAAMSRMGTLLDRDTTHHAERLINEGKLGVTPEGRNLRARILPAGIEALAEHDSSSKERLRLCASIIEKLEQELTALPRDGGERTVSLELSRSDGMVRVLLGDEIIVSGFTLRDAEMQLAKRACGRWTCG